jgi:hypothetical protein
MIIGMLSQSIISAVEKMLQDRTSHSGGVTGGVQRPITFGKAVAFFLHEDIVISGSESLIIASVRHLASAETKSAMQEQQCKTQ